MAENKQSQASLI